MSFTLATFNTYWLFDNEEPLKRWGLKLPDGGIDEKIENTANAILSIGPSGPDIIALQEVEGPVTLEPLLDKLQEKNSEYKYFWCSETLDPLTGQNVAVISKFPAAVNPITRLDQTTIDYIDSRQREKVGSLGKFLRVDIEVDGDVLSLFVVHLKSRRGGAQNTRFLRDAQAKIIRRMSLPRVEQGSLRSPCFIAIVGDFNDEPKTSPLDITQGMRDPSYDLISATQNLPEDEQWTYIHDETKQQLDHILLNKFAFERLTESGFTRIDGELSDHDAVWATIELNPGPDNER